VAAAIRYKMNMITGMCNISSLWPLSMGLPADRQGRGAAVLQVAAPAPAPEAVPWPPAGSRLAATSEVIAGSACGPRRTGGALPLAYGGTGPRYGD
jgi:hypothetical protein